MKSKLIYILAAVSIILSGCTRSIPNNPNTSFESSPSSQNSDQSSESLSQSSSSNSSSENQDSDNDPKTSSENANTWKMEEEYRKIEPFSDSIEQLGKLGMSPGHILFTTGENFNIIMDYDLQNNTWQEIGTYDKWQIMSTDQIQMGRKNYFAYSDIGGQYRMVCIDPVKQEISYPNSFAYFPPMAAYEAMDNTHFYLYLPDMGSSGERQYHVCLYDTETNDYQEIYTANYSETSDTGTIIQDISAQDGNLYICCADYKPGGDYTYKIIICNSNGEQQQEIILDDLKTRLQQEGEHLEHFMVLGDCFFFKALGSGPRYLYAYEDGSLRLLELPADHLLSDYQRGDSLRDRNENPYYYFWDYATKTLYPFNCQTKEFSKLQLGDAESETLKISILDDAAGNLLVSYFRYKTDQKFSDYYYIPQSTILKYME